ncbi:MAG: 1,4-alpha-glucan branching protein GlgB [Bryobacteraceae bacterium]|nr:1,4-alpha-glucan branching protein GlgB [Bryobacteraceae bacterium]
MDSIAGGYHGDPFSILGPHQTEAGWEIRVWMPLASDVSVMTMEGSVTMRRVHPEGFFVAELAGRPGTYMLNVTDAQGTHLVEDAYRFPPLITSFDLHLFGEGSHQAAYKFLGAHVQECEGVAGVHFAVWAPSANAVLLTGDFNQWNLRALPMRRRDGGVWELFVPGLEPGAIYKYYVRSSLNGYSVLKADPYAFAAELPPATGSIVTAPDRFEWHDESWLARRMATNWHAAPMSLYEVHLGSWLRGEDGRELSYRQLAAKLIPYAVEMNYTHLELLPITEHPFSGSWGYQVTGMFAPTSRHGSPDDFRYFVDQCHQAGLGVILDWVPGHFPRDLHGLHYFDGSFLYEHADPRRGEHKEWGTLIFNYGRPEVQSFLLSSAAYWLEAFHLDGFRVDAVASMLYLDFGKQEGEWLPNRYGGTENLEAISFLRRFNEACHRQPGILTIAEESTSFPGVTHPTYVGGLGFSMKWNMGWMHDMFNYFKLDPVFRKGSHQSLTFSIMYAFSESFVLPISHDEVVHGKSSLIGKMPGDEWQRFANARCFLAYMYGHPGKKLLFMGQEIAQYEEWNENKSVRWNLLQYAPHREIRSLVTELNRLHRDEPALHEVDNQMRGFEWVDFKDVESSVLAFLRRGRDGNEVILFVCNFTPVVRYNYRLGVPKLGIWDEILNTDAARFGGSGVSSGSEVHAEAVASHERRASIRLALPPLAVVAYKWRRPPGEEDPDKLKSAPLPFTDADVARIIAEQAIEDPELAYALAHQKIDETHDDRN